VLTIHLFLVDQNDAALRLPTCIQEKNLFESWQGSSVISFILSNTCKESVFALVHLFTWHNLWSFPCLTHHYTALQLNQNH